MRGSQAFRVSVTFTYTHGPAEKYTHVARSDCFSASLQLGHDGATPESCWLVDELSVAVPTKGVKYIFACKCWLAKDRGDGLTSRVFNVLDAEAISISKQVCDCGRKHVTTDKTRFRFGTMSPNITIRWGIFKNACGPLTLIALKCVEVMYNYRSSNIIKCLPQDMSLSRCFRLVCPLSFTSWLSLNGPSPRLLVFVASTL